MGRPSSSAGSTHLVGRALQALGLQLSLCKRHSLFHSDMLKQASVEGFCCPLPREARLQLRLLPLRIWVPLGRRSDLHRAAARPAAPDCRSSRAEFTTAGLASRR